MLMLFDIRLVIVMVFLLSTLLVVLCTIRKLTTFRAYAGGNRQFSTPSLVSTALACYYGGGMYNDDAYYKVLLWTLLGRLEVFWYYGCFLCIKLD